MNTPRKDDRSNKTNNKTAGKSPNAESSIPTNPSVSPRDSDEIPEKVVEDEGETKEGLSEATRKFFADLNKMRQEGVSAAEVARPAIHRIVKAICFRDNGQAIRLRRVLLGLYYCVPIRFGDDMVSLDWELRKDIVAVILAWNNGPFGEKDLTEALCRNGDRDLVWFRRGLTGEEAIWSK